MCAPGAIAVVSAAANNWAPRPVRLAPDGPTQIPIGTGEACSRSSRSAIRPRETIAPSESIWRIKACEPLACASAIAVLILSIRISSIRPLTCTTSTGASFVESGPDCPGPEFGGTVAFACGANRPTPAATARKMIASLRKESLRRACGFIAVL